VKILVAVLAAVFLTACTLDSPPDYSEAGDFLRMYNEVDQRLYTVASEANWDAAVSLSEEATGRRIGAESALAAFRGSPQIIEACQGLLEARESLTDLEFRQLDKILLLAAEYPGTIHETVERRVAEEARIEATLDSFQFCTDRRGERCVNAQTLNQIENTLRESSDLNERRRVWELSKSIGPALKPGLVELRNLRNEVAHELGYSSYFHLQVADYGLSVEQLMHLMDSVLADVRPLYEEIHQFARRRLAERYGQPVPEQIPAHWLPESHGQSWSGLVESVDQDRFFEGRTAEWIVEQAENFYKSMGMEPLPEEFWERSDLYALASGSPRRKNIDARTWHIDRDRDIRTVMNVEPSFRWFETSHHELGHAHYDLVLSNADVPHVLREGLNRAFQEAIGGLIGRASRQQPYLREIRVVPPEVEFDQREQLLAEALDEGIVFLVWAAGVVTEFERDLYEGELPAEGFNRRWWDLKVEQQGIVPPGERDMEGCDGCSKTHIIDDPAQYYDYVLATLIKHQLHDYIAREILKQDPRSCNYYGSREVGEWLSQILRLGATRDWRVVLEEMTGEPLSSRALLEYYSPLNEYLAELNSQ
jgi:peptidyl-dipeptidase A